MLQCTTSNEKVRGFEVVKQYEAIKDTIKLPARSTEGAAGYDFFALSDCPMCKGDMGMISTGIKAYMPKGEVLILANRSSNPKKGLELANSIGVIDGDFFENEDNDGHIMFLFKATANVHIKAGDKIGQGIFIPYLLADNDVVTTKRTGGFGSSGR